MFYGKCDGSKSHLVQQPLIIVDDGRRNCDWDNFDFLHTTIREIPDEMLDGIVDIPQLTNALCQSAAGQKTDRTDRLSAI